MAHHLAVHQTVICHSERNDTNYRRTIGVEDSCKRAGRNPLKEYYSGRDKASIPLYSCHSEILSFPSLLQRYLCAQKMY